MSYLLYALAALKVWMLVDAVQRGVAGWWYWVIVGVPFGSVVYFVLVKALDHGIAIGPSRYRPRRASVRPADLEQLRYRFQQNPCLANEARLAASLYDAGEIDEAMQHYRGVLRRDGDYQRALYGLGLCHTARGEHAEAVEVLGRLLDQERSYADYGAWLHRARALAAAGDGDGSLEALEGLFKACPRLDHCVALAGALLEAGRSDEARAHLEQALLDFDHSPRHVKRQFRAAARDARNLLAQV